ncbi:MAG: DMT family transporter [Pseudomonadota bacterium]|jgi:drug/metabolite transporter (DMT)-like permease
MNRPITEASLSSRWRVSPYLLLVLTVLFWSGNWVVGRGIRADVPPIALSFWRWVIAFVCLLPVAWPHVRRQWRTLLRQWKVLAALGLFGGACHNALTYIGLTHTTATNGVLLASATPIMIIGLSWALLGKRLRRLEGIGVTVSFSGILVIVSHGEWARLLELRPNVGDLWVLAAMLFWALYTVLLAWRPPGLHPYSFLAAISLVGLAALAPFYGWEMAAGRLIVPGVHAFAAIAYAGIFPALLGFIFWNRAVAEVGGNKAGLFMHLMPAFGTLLSVIFLGERPYLFHFAGIALILAGIYLTARARPPLPAAD